ncbi:tripartite tricarboxylate transporter substrate binding protein [soil metagenome]
MKHPLVVLAGLCAAITGFNVQAQTAASHTLRIIVPYPAGGIADALAREVAMPLGPILGQTVVVENRPGAAGSMAATYVKNAEADGTTLLFTNVGPSAIAPAMSKTAPYDPAKDFTAVSLVSKSPLMLLVPGKSEIRDVKGLIALAKSKPGAIEYSSAGVGSVGHLSGALFSQAAAVDMLHVPYQGQSPANVALMTGEVQMTFTAPSAQTFEFIKDGKFRLLGISYPQATALVPGGVPIADTVKGFDAQYWFGLVAPAKTNPAVIKRIDAAVQQVLADPNTAKRFLVMGNEVATGTPAQFQSLLESESVRWRDVVKAANISQSN